jgi:hypothetical protein
VAEEELTGDLLDPEFPKQPFHLIGVGVERQ